MSFPPLRTLAAAAAVLALAGCATVDFDQELAATGQAQSAFTQGPLSLARTAQHQAERAAAAERLLAQPLTQDAAVQLALVNSPALQALLAQSWNDMAIAGQGGRIANPVFTFERLRLGPELEIGRLLSFGLLDLLTLPARQQIAHNQQAQLRVQLGATVVEQVSRVRQAWVRAVAAQQSQDYAQQVQQAAEASAELARRMQQAGNFTRLQRARQQAFYADATSQLAMAQHTATAAREELVRLLGLDDAQAPRLQLPPQLPALPREPRSPEQVAGAAREQRLDWQLARLQLESAGRAQGLDLANSLIDTELGLRRDTVFDNASGERGTARGWELSLRLPLFDWGSERRAAMNAQSLAAAQRYEAVSRAASSLLREGYSAYRTAYELARHYRDEVVPLRKTISDENLLRYNGMLIGVFELLADAREQIGSVSAALQAQQQFWLADAALSAALVGQPLETAGPAAPAPSRPAQAAGH